MIAISINIGMPIGRDDFYPSISLDASGTVDN